MHHHVECDSLSHVDDLEGLVSKMWRDQTLNLSCISHLLFYCCTLLLLSLSLRLGGGGSGSCN